MVKIAAAQIPSFKADIQRNIEEHLLAIQVAGKESASLIFFPELSITGYELALAESLALSASDINAANSPLAPLKTAAQAYQMHIVAGAPLKTASGLALASLIVQPDGHIDYYAKIFLHGEEKKYFTPGTTYKCIDIGEEKIALSICADSMHDEHFASAAHLKATIYTVSLLLTANGYRKDTKILAYNAQKHRILVAMANHCQATGGWDAAGMSAAWGEKGLIAQIPDKQKALLIYEKNNNHWQAKKVVL